MVLRLVGDDVEPGVNLESKVKVMLFDIVVPSFSFQLLLLSANKR